MDYQHNTKDRPLGQSKLEVKQLITEEPNQKEQPYITTGQIQRTVNLQTDNGRSVKGSLVYEANFFPAIRLRGVAFSQPTSPLTKVAPPPGNDDDDNASFIEPDEDGTLDIEDELSQQMNAEASGALAVKPERISSRALTSSSLTGDKMTPNGAGMPIATTSNPAAPLSDGVSLSRDEILGYRKLYRILKAPPIKRKLHRIWSSNLKYHLGPIG